MWFFASCCFTQPRNLHLLLTESFTLLVLLATQQGVLQAACPNQHQHKISQNARFFQISRHFSSGRRLSGRSGDGSRVRTAANSLWDLGPINSPCAAAGFFPPLLVYSYSLGHLKRPPSFLARNCSSML